MEKTDPFFDLPRIAGGIIPAGRQPKYFRQCIITYGAPFPTRPDVSPLNAAIPALVFLGLFLFNCFRFRFTAAFRRNNPDGIGSGHQHIVVGQRHQSGPRVATAQLDVLGQDMQHRVLVAVAVDILPVCFHVTGAGKDHG